VITLKALYLVSSVANLHRDTRIRDRRYEGVQIQETELVERFSRFINSCSQRHLEQKWTRATYDVTDRYSLLVLHEHTWLYMSRLSVAAEANHNQSAAEA
jgi:hypothetical protein